MEVRKTMGSRNRRIQGRESATLNSCAAVFFGRPASTLET